LIHEGIRVSPDKPFHRLIMPDELTRCCRVQVQAATSCHAAERACHQSAAVHGC
jgi:hypothetical protein